MMYVLPWGLNMTWMGGRNNQLSPWAQEWHFERHTVLGNMGDKSLFSLLHPFCLHGCDRAWLCFGQRSEEFRAAVQEAAGLSLSRSSVCQPQSLAKTKPLSKQVGCPLCCPKFMTTPNGHMRRESTIGWNSMAVVPAGLDCNCRQKPYKNRVTAAGSFCLAALS